MSYDLIAQAIHQSFNTSTYESDGWEPQINRSAVVGARPRVAQITIPNQQYVRLVFASVIHEKLLSVEAPPDITFISAQTHPDCDLLTPVSSILKRDSLLGFVVADTKWEAEAGLQRIVIQTEATGHTFSKSKDAWTIPSAEMGALETECCVVHKDQILHQRDNIQSFKEIHPRVYGTQLGWCTLGASNRDRTHRLGHLVCSDIEYAHPS